MTVRFVLEESSWALAANQWQHFPGALENLLYCLEVATERGEGIVNHQDFYEVDLGDGLKLFSVLFEIDCVLTIERDLGERLRLALDRMKSFDEAGLTSYDVTIADPERFSPGVSWAHYRRTEGHAVAVLPLPLDATLRGELAVTVGNCQHFLHFVTNEQEHRAFFRNVVMVEDIGPDGFPEIAKSAFPDLAWVDGVWRELNGNRAYFFDDNKRSTLVTHLSVLNDWGAELFHLHPGGNGVAEELNARGVDASSENGRARSYPQSIAARRRRYDGADQVFWWHTKIRWNAGRIHFVYIPDKPGSPRSTHGQIVVGIFAEHCVLPS